MLTITRQIIHQIVIIIRPDQFLGIPSAGATARNEQIDSHRALGALIIAEMFSNFYISGELLNASEIGYCAKPEQ